MTLTNYESLNLIGVKEARAILGSDSKGMSDEEIRALVIQFDLIAALIVSNRMVLKTSLFNK